MPIKIQDILNIPEPSAQEWAELAEDVEESLRIEHVIKAFEDREWKLQEPPLRPKPRTRRFRRRKEDYWDEPAP